MRGKWNEAQKDNHYEVVHYPADHNLIKTQSVCLITQDVCYVEPLHLQIVLRLGTTSLCSPQWSFAPFHLLSSTSYMWVVLVDPLGSYRGGKSEQFSGSSGAELAYWSSRHGKQQNLCHSLALTLAKNQGNGWHRQTRLNRSGRYRNWSSTVLRTFTTLYKRFPKVGQVLGLFNLALQNIHQGPRQILSLHSST